MAKVTGSLRRCNENTPKPLATPGKSINLLKRPEKFQSEEAHVPCQILAKNPCYDGGRLVGYKA